MPHDYMVRITHSYQDASGVVALWAARADKMVVYEHIGSLTEKIHIHMVIVGSDTHKKQLRNIGMATGLELKGNKYCSFKEYDGEDRPYVYMTKGKHDPSFVKGYEPAQIARWKALWEDQPQKGTDAKLYEQVFGDVDYNRECYEAEGYTKGTEFTWVKRTARTRVLMANQFIWNLKAINWYKMLVYTYCYRNELQIPLEDKIFKEF